MRTIESLDNPWHRLPWTLPTALVIWAVALWGLAFFMGKPTNVPTEAPPIDAQFIEQPVIVVQHNQPKRPIAVHHPIPQVPKPVPVQQSKPLPLVRQQQMPTQVGPHMERNQAHQQAGITTNTVLATPGNASEAIHAIAARSTNTSGNRVTHTGPTNGKGRGNMHANGGARAILRPMPKIPDDLRDSAFNYATLARFHIAVDGGVTVELVESTPNIRLNGILLNSLKKWRFMPAIKGGKPVASTEEIVVKLTVN